MEEILLKTVEDTRSLAKNISKLLPKKNCIILLKGDLGSGKTFFTNALINIFLEKYNMNKIQITSPTFNLVKDYQIKDLKIFHFDLYRLKNVSEIYELNIEEAFQNISIIEWPEIVEDILPFKTIEISIKEINNIRYCNVKYFNQNAN